MAHGNAGTELKTYVFPQDRCHVFDTLTPLQIIPGSREPRTVAQIVADMNERAGYEAFQVLRGGIAPILYDWQMTVESQPDA
jgi:hypothetical protein